MYLTIMPRKHGNTKENMFEVLLFLYALRFMHLWCQELTSIQGNSISDKPQLDTRVKQLCESERSLC